MKLRVSPLARRLRSDQGAALLVVLLLVATLSVISLGVMQIVTSATRVAGLSGSRSQAIWYVRGAEDIARIKVKEIFEASDGKITRYTPGLGQDIPFDIEGGALIARVEDYSNCFNLNSLGQSADDQENEESPEPDAATFYTSLLETLGFDTSTAIQLRSALEDWIDADNTPRPSGAESYYYSGLERPYLAADGPLVARSELRAIQGYDRETYRRIAPYVCAMPGKTIARFNVNTLKVADAPLLVPVFSNLITLDAMVGILSLQADIVHNDVDEFLADPSFAAIEPEKRLASPC